MQHLKETVERTAPRFIAIVVMTFFVVVLFRACVIGE